jgi:hypothetical protein
MARLSEIGATTLSHILNAIERVPVEFEPFPHIAVRPFFPPEVFEAMLGAFPAMSNYRGFRIYTDAEGHTTRYKFDLRKEYLAWLSRDQRALWGGVSSALRSPQLAALFKSKFRAALEERFGREIERVRLHPVSILMRDFDGFSVPVHPDTKIKAITCLCYLTPDERQRELGTHIHETLKDGTPGDAVKKVPYVPNQAIAFAVSDHSYHSVPVIGDLIRPRDTLLLVFLDETRLVRIIFHRGKRVSSFLGHVLRIRRAGRQRASIGE